MFFEKLSLIIFIFCFNLSLFAQESNPNQNKQIALTESEKKLLEEGEISGLRYGTGGVLGTLIGFGSGHAVVGKYKERGWLFTLGELSAWAIYAIGEAGYSGSGLTEMFSGNSQPDNSGTAFIVVGYLGFLGFRIVEIVDVWSRPYDHNKSYRELQEKLKLQNEEKSALYIVPLVKRQSAGLNLVLTF